MQTEFDFPQHEIKTIEEALVIRVVGDNAPSGGIADGKYVFLKGHSTLPDGGYIANGGIQGGAALTSSNLTTKNGIINDAVAGLSGQLTTVSNNLTKAISGMVKIVGAANKRYLTISGLGQYDGYGTLFICSYGKWASFTIGGATISRVSGDERFVGSHNDGVYTIDTGSQYEHWFAILGGSISGGTVT